MSYNTELQSNNADLQEILDAVNALPEAGGGVELPELTNPGTAEDLEDGKELIDAEGNIVTGTVRVAHGGITQDADSIDRIPMGDQSRIKLTVYVEEKTIVKPSAGNTISLTAPCSEFGDAEAADVAKGKTFTSAAGLKVVGTKEESGGGGGSGMETCTVTVTKDDSYCVLGVQVIDGVPVPFYNEDSSAESTWTAPCGSVVAIGVGFDFAYDCNGMTYVGTDDALTYIVGGTMGWNDTGHIKLFRIDAGAGETASIDVYESF